ncbi:RNA polymerase sigma factor [Streptomyces sp. AB3(2024)]|uniref:RNA polymerase sigma factor n=1 Tax=Streptomyces sp. AB3(2024) TaxID=3317321 RepID=UPI0035A33008
MPGSRDTADRPRPADGGPVAAPSDAELTRRLRLPGGDAEEATVRELLYRRHRRAALACARTCCRTPQDAEDLVSEAFLRTFQAVRSGSGPRGPWRAYLLAVVRHTAMEWRECAGRILLTSDFDSWCRPAPGGDPQGLVMADEDRRLVARSFRALPARWQAVLWQTLVEEESPHRIAARLGITPSAVNSLAFRAREGLREAYLGAHLDAAAGGGRCGHYGGMLGTAVRRGGTRSPRGLVRHLAGCGRCARAYAELLDLNATLRGAPAPVPA